MPWKLCNVSGCVLPALKSGRCITHYRVMRAAADGRRPNAHERGYATYEWRTKIRPAILRRDPYCTVDGCDELSTDVDHIVPRARGGSDDESNLRGLCHRHHSIRTAGDMTR